MKKLLLLSVGLFIQTITAQVTDTGGNVGIGTETPTQKLEVNGNVKAIAANPNIAIIGQGTGNYQGASLFLSANGVNSGNEHASTWIMNHRGTNGVATFTLQRRNILNEFKGSLLSYSDGIGWKFNVASTVTTSGTNSAMIINNIGNVGIGTTNPEKKLHIKAAADDGVALETNNALLGKTSSGAFTQLLFWNGSNAYYGRNATGAGVNNHYFRTVGTDRMVINSIGNVGIGTTSPKNKLHVTNGNSGGVPHGFSDFIVEDDDHVMLSLLAPNNKTAYYGFADQDDDYVGGMQYEHGANRMTLRVNNHGNDMTIINNGNVGIGTTSPDSKLTVAGNIHSREVKVTVNAGADFVFDEEYNLPKLEEVQDFIDENGHLPEIASATEMEENGIHLSEMNIKLLQKIEELTLYTIGQEKKLQDQDEEIEKIKTQLTQLLKK